MQDALNAQYGMGQWPSPLASADILLFLYKPGDMLDRDGNPIGPGIGGMAYLLARADCQALTDICNGAPTDIAGSTLWGLSLVLWTTANIVQNTWIVTHEYAHMMGGGFSHHPGANQDNPVTNKCYYGNYSIMRATIPNNVNFPSIDHFMQMAMGWATTYEATDERSIYVLADCSDAAQVLTIPIRRELRQHSEWPGHPEYTTDIYNSEYFLLAYDKGLSPFYAAADTGLYVWHVVDERIRYANDNPPLWQAGDWGWPRTVYLDLETATGLYDDPSASPGYWQQPRPDIGYDTLDHWIDVATGLPRLNYSNYLGSEYDLFALQDHAEMNYFPNSNPCTKGLVWTLEDIGNSNCGVVEEICLSRRTPQEAPSSLAIKIVDYINGAVVVEVTLAPHETVITPNGGEVMVAGEQQIVEWTRDSTVDKPGGIIDVIDVLLSVNDGLAWESVASGIDAGQGYCTWTPAIGQASEAARLRIVCHNSVTDHFGIDESDGAFVIAPAMSRVLPVSKSMSNIEYPGQPYSSIPLDYDNDGDQDLLIALSDEYGRCYELITVTPLEHEPVFYDRTESAFAIAPLPVGLRGLAAGDYDNDGLVDLFAAAEINACLYHNEQDGTFADRTATLGIAPYCTDSWAGAWGDANRDGQLDLFVCRADVVPGQEPTPQYMLPIPSYLLRNRVRETGTFVDVSEASNIEGSRACLSAAWADIDGDKDLDLLVGNLMDYSGPSNPAIRLYVNYGEGTFSEVDETPGRFPDDEELQAISAVSWADYDNDGDMDVSLSSQSAAFVQPWVLFNDGAGVFAAREPIRLPIPEPTCDVRALDQDLDGRMDVMLVPWAGTTAPWLFRNRSVAGVTTMVNEAGIIGLTTAETTRGAAIADFTGDGDPELFLGRQTAADQFLYRSVRWDGSDAPAANWVGVRLVPNSGANNESGIGAVVTVKVGDPQAPIHQQARMVDGGSGRGGQDSQTLIFGLGDLASPVQATVRWPGGFVQSQALTTGEVNVINDLTAPTMVVIKNVSPVFTYEVVPGTEQVDWTFQWQTEFSCDPSLDQVRVVCRPGQPASCLCQDFTLHVGDPGVEALVVTKVNGRYAHVVTWRGVPCETACSYEFTVGSATQRPGSLREKTFVGTISICPTVYDPEG